MKTFRFNDFKHFLEISLGLLSEVVACLDMARDLKLINIFEFDKLVLMAEGIARQLGGFSRKLKFDIS